MLQKKQSVHAEIATYSLHFVHGGQNDPMKRHDFIYDFVYKTWPWPICKKSTPSLSRIVKSSKTTPEIQKSRRPGISAEQQFSTMRVMLQGTEKKEESLLPQA